MKILPGQLANGNVVAKKTRKSFQKKSIYNNCCLLTPFEPLPKDLPPIAAVLVPRPVGLGTGNIHTFSLSSQNYFLFTRHTGRRREKRKKKKMVHLKSFHKVERLAKIC